MGLKTYDPRKWDIIFAGILLNEGTADGTFLTVTTDGPAFTEKVGTDGTTTRARQHNKLAKAILTLMQTSEVNDRLSALLAADRAAVNGQGVGAFYVQDRAGTTVLQASKSYISDDPDVELSNEATTRDWEFTLTDYMPVHGGNADE